MRPSPGTLRTPLESIAAETSPGASGERVCGWRKSSNAASSVASSGDREHSSLEGAGNHTPGHYTFVLC